MSDAAELSVEVKELAAAQMPDREWLMLIARILVAILGKLEAKE